MKNLFLCACIVSLSLQVRAQNAQVEELIVAEKTFAKLAGETNVRDAFLAYMTDNTVLFDASGPTGGKKMWEQRKPSDMVLKWEPSIADVAESGEFGFTCGPAEFRPSPSGDPFYGAYVAVWTKDENKKWKMAVDIGVYPQPEAKVATIVVPEKKKFRKGKETLMEAEQGYVAAIEKNDDAKCVQKTAQQSWYYRVNNAPFSDKKDIQKLLTDERGSSFKPVNYLSSANSEMGCVYGTCAVARNGEKKNANYMRIWKRDSKGDWKLLIDIISE